MAYKTVQHLVLCCFSDLISCHSPPSLCSRQLNFPVPEYFKHACASEFCISVPSAWQALPQILHTTYTSFKSQYKWHLIKKHFHNLPNGIHTWPHSLFCFLAFIIIEPSVCIILFIVLLYPTEFKLHQSRQFLFCSPMGWIPQHLGQCLRHGRHSKNSR